MKASFLLLLLGGGVRKARAGRRSKLLLYAANVLKPDVFVGVCLFVCLSVSVGGRGEVFLFLVCESLIRHFNSNNNVNNINNNNM